jgi:hypothetical protein
MYVLFRYLGALESHVATTCSDKGILQLLMRHFRIAFRETRVTLGSFLVDREIS